MKSGQVLKRLRITRATLTRYVKEGKIKVKLLTKLKEEIKLATES